MTSEVQWVVLEATIYQSQVLTLAVGLKPHFLNTKCLSLIKYYLTRTFYKKCIITSVNMFTTLFPIWTVDVVTTKWMNAVRTLPNNNIDMSLTISSQLYAKPKQSQCVYIFTERPHFWVESLNRSVMWTLGVTHSCFIRS